MMIGGSSFLSGLGGCGMVKRHFLGFVFLTLLIFSGLRLLSTSSSASGPVTSADATPGNASTFSISFPIILGAYCETADPSIDLSIERIEATQAVQDLVNSVPLVSGRQTVVRVYIRSDAPGKLDGIHITLSGTAGGHALDNSPLSTLDTVYQTSNRGEYTSTINFLLPVGWLNESQIALTAEVDVDNIVLERDETNNSLTNVFTFTQVAPLDLEIVPIRYTHTPNNTVYGAPGDTISDIIYRLYPVPTVTVSIHPALSFSGDLTQSAEWGNLLEAVDLLKKTENAPDSRVYYGLIPSAWFNGGYAGLGYVGWRTSIGLQLEDPIWGEDAGGYAAAHEIGHNLGSNHAPGCGVITPDPNWPWPDDGHTHEYGLDVATLQVKLPVANDVMGYCRDGGFWISSYTYRNFLNNQQVYGQASLQELQQPQEVLYIRASLNADDKAILQPIYHLNAVPSSASAAGDYWVQLLDVNGNELARYPVDIKTAEGDGITFRMISALVPMPAGIPAQVRLYRGAIVLAERQLQTAPKLLSGLQLASSTGGLVLNWIGNAQSALVRYTSDNGATWTTLAFDVTTDELTIDPTGLASGGYFEVSFGDTNLPVRLISTIQ
jgi:hypothetical protein